MKAAVSAVASVLACTALVALVCPLPAAAHDWYPQDCCSGQDCIRGDQMFIDERGDRIVLVGPRRIWVSKYLSPRPSPDARVHICVREVNGELDGSLFPMTICLFVPAES